MNLHRAFAAYFAATSVLALAPLARAQDDVADVPSQDLRINGDEHKRYFLIGPNEGAKAPKDGFKLLIIMPGGDGSAEFNAFVKRIYKNALPPGYIVAEPVAFKWTAKQE